MHSVKSQLSLAISALLLAAVLAADASAAPTTGIKPKKLVVPGYLSLLPAVDGADVYWVSYEKVKRTKDSYEATLNRSSLVGRKRVRVARFQADGYSVEGLSAGGGQVVVNLERGGIDTPLYTRVVRMSRNGSNQQVLATGSRPGWVDESVVEDGRARTNDCGTHARADSMTDTGAVLLMQTTSERESSACGAKPNVDRVRVTEVALTGVTREVYTDEIQVEPAGPIGTGTGTGTESETHASTPGVASANPWQPRVRVSHDRAIFERPSDGLTYVRDLNSGALAGPYGTGLKGPATLNFSTLDPSGRVAMSAISLRTSKRKSSAPQRTWLAFRSGIFNTPLNPTPFTHKREMLTIQFCGSRLIGATKTAYVELDPKTLRVRRTIAIFPKSSGPFALGDQCTDKYAYVFRPWKNELTVLGFPLE